MKIIIIFICKSLYLLRLYNNKRIQNIYLKTMENYVSFYKDFGNNVIINETNWE